jgi:hypothetical protein
MRLGPVANLFPSQASVRHDRGRALPDHFANESARDVYDCSADLREKIPQQNVGAMA